MRHTKLSPHPLDLSSEPCFQTFIPFAEALRTAIFLLRGGCYEISVASESASLGSGRARDLGRASHAAHIRLDLECARRGQGKNSDGNRIRISNTHEPPANVSGLRGAAGDASVGMLASGY